MNENKQETVWQYARRSFSGACQCGSPLAVTMPTVHNRIVIYQAMCPKCHEAHYITATTDKVDLSRSFIESEE